MDPSEAFSTSPAAAPPVGQRPIVEAGEMPAWLAKPAAPPSAAQRWGRRFMFLGAAVLTVALAGGATMLGLDLYESQRSMEVVAGSSQANPVSPGTLPFVEKRPTSVPPLVLLPPDPNGKKEAPAVAVPVAGATEPAASVIVTKDVKEVVSAPVPAPVRTAPDTTTAPIATPKALPAAPVAAAPAPPAAAAAPTAEPVVRPKVALAKKPAPAAKRPATPVLAKVKPAKPIKGTMLQPPRERSEDSARDDAPAAPRQAIDRRCRPGELARECEARTR